MKLAYLTLPALLVVSAAGAQADSLDNASKASGDSVVAVAELAESGVKVVLGAVAVPVVIVGSAAEGVGGALHDGGESLWASANGPLQISPETPTAQPAPQVPYDVQGGEAQDGTRRN